MTDSFKPSPRSAGLAQAAGATVVQRFDAERLAVAKAVEGRTGGEAVDALAAHFDAILGQVLRLEAHESEAIARLCAISATSEGLGVVIERVAWLRALLGLGLGAQVRGFFLAVAEAVLEGERQSRDEFLEGAGAKKEGRARAGQAVERVIEHGDARVADWSDGGEGETVADIASIFLPDQKF